MGVFLLMWRSVDFRRFLTLLDILRERIFVFFLMRAAGCRDLFLPVLVLSRLWRFCALSVVLILLWKTESTTSLKIRRLAVSL